jgi:outer membrane protein assembly factor BamB
MIQVVVQHIIIALDKDSGNKLWEFNVGSPIGIGGPSIGNGMLLVPTGSLAELGANTGHYVVAFDVPSTAERTATNGNMQEDQ